MSESELKHVNGSEQQPGVEHGVEEKQLIMAVGEYHQAFVAQNMKVGADGKMYADFDPLTLLVQTHVDRVTVQELVKTLEAAGLIDRKALLVSIAQRLSAISRAMKQQSHVPRILVPR